ncbi:transcriptional adapter 2-alpha, partial [Phenoliferia sp. Uapishka_3]
MTITKRKKASDETSTAEDRLLSGTKSSCDACSADVTHSVHFRCAELKERPEGATERLTCPDFDLCVQCFRAGKTTGPHRSTHAYRIISSHAFPIFTADWGADEELLLIEGAEMYGLGNWADISDHIGGRTKEECEDHYREVYLRSPNYPLPVPAGFNTDHQAFQQRKKQRLEEVQTRPFSHPPPKPLASAPTCHEIGGYMPGRLEFETEYENEAENLIKDMEFGKVYQFGGDQQPAGPEVALEVKPEGGDGDPGEESDGELDLKLSVMEIFNERYDRRVASKDLIFDRGLLFANERKRPKEERDLILRTKVFARIQTADDHEEFVDGLLYELALRRRIAELQEYRRMGVTSLAEGERFDHAKAQRQSAKQASYRDSISFPHDRAANRQARLPNPLKTARPSTSALTLATSSSLHLLTTLEQNLCSTLRILPRPYLFLKETLMREWVRLGGRMGASDARRVGGNATTGTEWGEKIERVFEFLLDSGGLRLPEEEGEGEEDTPDSSPGPGGDDADGDDEDDGMDVDAPLENRGGATNGGSHVNGVGKEGTGITWLITAPLLLSRLPNFSSLPPSLLPSPTPLPRVMTAPLPALKAISTTKSRSISPASGDLLKSKSKTDTRPLPSGWTKIVDPKYVISKDVICENVRSVYEARKLTSTLPPSPPSHRTHAVSFVDCNSSPPRIISVHPLEVRVSLRGAGTALIETLTWKLKDAEYLAQGSKKDEGGIVSALGNGIFNFFLGKPDWVHSCEVDMRIERLQHEKKNHGSRGASSTTATASTSRSDDPSIAIVGPGDSGTDQIPTAEEKLRALLRDSSERAARVAPATSCNNSAATSLDDTDDMHLNSTLSALLDVAQATVWGNKPSSGEEAESKGKGNSSMTDHRSYVTPLSAWACRSLERSTFQDDTSGRDLEPVESGERGPVQPVGIRAPAVRRQVPLRTEVLSLEDSVFHMLFSFSAVLMSIQLDSKSSERPLTSLSVFATQRLPLSQRGTTSLLLARLKDSPLAPLSSNVFAIGTLVLPERVVKAAEAFIARALELEEDAALEEEEEGPVRDDGYWSADQEGRSRGMVGKGTEDGLVRSPIQSAEPTTTRPVAIPESPLSSQSTGSGSINSPPLFQIPTTNSLHLFFQQPAALLPPSPPTTFDASPYPDFCYSDFSPAPHPFDPQFSPPTHEKPPRSAITAPPSSPTLRSSSLLESAISSPSSLYTATPRSIRSSSAPPISSPRVHHVPHVTEDDEDETFFLTLPSFPDDLRSSSPIPSSSCTPPPSPRFSSRAALSPPPAKSHRKPRRVKSLVSKKRTPSSSSSLDESLDFSPSSQVDRESNSRGRSRARPRTQASTARTYVPKSALPSLLLPSTTTYPAESTSSAQPDSEEDDPRFVDLSKFRKPRSQAQGRERRRVTNSFVGDEYRLVAMGAAKAQRTGEGYWGVVVGRELE